jgi:hypothetical protein
MSDNPGFQYDVFLNHSAKDKSRVRSVGWSATFVLAI